MEKKKKEPSPMAWVLGQTGIHGGQYVLSVVLAIIGVAFSIMPYFVVVGIVQGLMEGQREMGFYLNRCLMMALLWVCRV
ncbi:MAG: ABC transporter ATP-binding protein, partial [Blautia sp.]|nr:ABC transporter ATP-binding protein [Blautia sp.]